MSPEQIVTVHLLLLDLLYFFLHAEAISRVRMGLLNLHSSEFFYIYFISISNFRHFSLSPIFLCCFWNFEIHFEDFWSRPDFFIIQHLAINRCKQSIIYYYSPSNASRPSPIKSRPSPVISRPNPIISRPSPTYRDLVPTNRDLVN